MIKLAQNTIDKEDIRLLIEWLSQEETPRLTKDKLTEEFEAEWSKKCGQKYSVFVNSGSSAILLGLYSLLEGGYLKNQKVVISSLSWITDVSSVVQIGLTPILCDCNLTDLSVDLGNLEEIFIREQPAALILVSVLGLVPRMKEIVDLCNKYDVILFEDVAESLGSKYQEQRLGTFGKISTYSLYFGHTISSIEGGIITTDDFDLYELMISLRSHGWDRDQSKETQQKLRTEWNIDNFNHFYTFHFAGFNLRSTDLQAFIGLNQLKKLDKYCEIRHNNFLIYLDKIKINELVLTEKELDFTSNFAFPIVSKNREKIVKSLIKNQIEVRPLIAGSIARSPFWIKRFGLQALINCDKIHNYGFYLPNHQELTIDEINFICKLVNEVKDEI
mgnify:CR=1 FL=1